jgi:hypothetical protein
MEGGDVVAKGLYEEWLTEDALEVLQGWARIGLTDEQIAENCGIAVRTLYEWKNKHPQIMQALKKGKAWADTEVENALFRRATGYDYEETTWEDGKKTKVVKKHVPGDVTAQIYWLKNRRPDLWRDKREDKGTGDDGYGTGVVMIPQVLTEEGADG